LRWERKKKFGGGGKKRQTHLEKHNALESETAMMGVTAAGEKWRSSTARKEVSETVEKRNVARERSLTKKKNWETK